MQQQQTRLLQYYVGLDSNGLGFLNDVTSTVAIYLNDAKMTLFFDRLSVGLTLFLDRLSAGLTLFFRVWPWESDEYLGENVKLKECLRVWGLETFSVALGINHRRTIFVSHTCLYILLKIPFKTHCFVFLIDKLII